MYCDGGDKFLMVQKLNKYTGNIGLSLNFQPTTISGLNISHNGGVVGGNGVVKETVAGSIAVPAGTAWTVYVNLTTGVLTSVATASLPTSNILILWDGTSGGSTVTSIRDVRSWTSTGNAVSSSLSFDTIVASWNPEFDYQWRGANAAAGLENDGSATLAVNDFPVIFSQGPDTFQVTNGDVNNPGFAVHLTDPDGYGHNGGTLYTPNTDWDMTSGSIVCIFRSDFNSLNVEHLFSMRAQSGFGISLKLDAAGHVEFFCKLATSSGGELNFDSGGTRTVVGNDNTWHIVVVTQDGGTVNNPIMYLDGAVEDSSGGSFDSNDDREFWFKTIFDSISSLRAAFGGAIGGADPGTSITQGFDGNLDRLIFMTKELTAQEVSDSHDAYFGL